MDENAPRDPAAARRRHDRPGWIMDRRNFLCVSAGALAGLATGCASFWSREPRGPRFGLVTDAHYADADAKGVRFYRESIGKMREAVDALRGENLRFLAELGDIKDMADGEAEARTLEHLVAIESELQRYGGPTYHVLGNHDMDNLSKAQVLGRIRNSGIAADRSYYGYRSGGIHFVVLDACFRSDGVAYDHGDFRSNDSFIPGDELAWLAGELDGDDAPVIVFAHQRLDDAGGLSVSNRAEVRAALEASGKVLAVFQGHDHKGAIGRINGIHYYTLRAIVDGSGPENGSYAVVEVDAELNVIVTGYRHAVGADLMRAEAAASA
jgi:hypothetical protein